MALTVLARNLPPSTTNGVYPLQIFTGVSDCVGRLCLINHPVNSNPNAMDSEIAMNMRDGIRTMMDLRQIAIRQERDSFEIPHV